MRLLVVDDEENILWSLGRALKHEGFEVSTAKNVDEAEALLSSREIDIVVTDLRMPGRDGFDLVRWARANKPHVRFVMATAYGSAQVRGAALRQGVVEFLEKPVNVHSLVGILRRLENPVGFAASLRNLSLFDLVQLIVLGRSTRCIEVGNGRDTCILTFVQGEVVDARGSDSEGDAAFLQILRWPGGDFREVAMPASPRQTVTRPTQELLFEAARLSDEEARQPAPEPPAPPAPPEPTKPAATVPVRPPEKPMPPNDKPLNLDNAVEIAPDVYWVGHRNPRSLLQINVYLRVFRGATSNVNMLVDPGSPVDLPVISKKVAQIIGDMGKIHLFTVNHQDPDVVANSVFIQRMNPKALCIATEDTWRLIAHYELDPARVRLVEKFKDNLLKLQTGHAVQFVPTPYCHFRGAVAVYDLASRVLFTGDLFGGLSPAQHKSLYASEASWDGVKAFHQIYMPSRKVLRRAVAAIRALNPPPLIIAPQHGDLLEGPAIDEFLNRVSELLVGADLMEDVEESTALHLTRDACNEVLALASSVLGSDQVSAKLTLPGTRARLSSLCSVNGAAVVSIHRATPEVLEVIESALCAGEGPEIISQIRMATIKAAVQRNLPVNTGRLEADDVVIASDEEEVIV